MTKMRGRCIAIIVLLPILISVKARAGDISSEALNPYKPTYFMLQYGTPDPRDDRQLYTKFQFNTRQPLADDYLFFAYTYTALWSITAESAPFKDNIHNPEVFLDIDNEGSVKIGQMGFEHESNGKGGVDSRSWNRVYWQPRLVYKRKEGELFGFDHFSLHIKGWVRFREEKSDNPDILDYYGNGELTAKIYGTLDYLAVKARKGLKKDYGNIQAEYMHRISKNLSVYAQFWDGYGESLIDYNKRSTRYGIGVALTR